jgi:peptide/nickel transport system permease protein
MNILSRVRGLTWAAALIARLAAGIAVLATAAFLLVQLAPGDPVLRLLGGSANAEDIARTRTALGLDRPLVGRYLTYMKSTVGLHFGRSFGGQPVGGLLASRLPNTVQLAACALLVTLVASVLVGIGMAALTNNERHGLASAVFTFIAGVFSSVPSYVLAMCLVALFAVTFPLFPVAGADGVSSLVLPALAIGIPVAAVLARIIRAEALNVLQSDYVRLARSKQIPLHRLYFRHVLPNVTTAALTIGGVLFGYLLGGSVIVENVFARPGLGTLLVESVNNRDYPVLQASIIVLGIGVLIVNTVVDLLIGILDPQVGRSR